MARRQTDNHERVFAHLRKAGAPLTAYQILEGMQDDRIRAPVTVYRALDRLVSEGRVHRIESLNAFVPCRAANHYRHAPVFAICCECGSVQEVLQPDLFDRLSAFALSGGFSVHEALVELRGRCADCAARSNVG